MLELVWKKEETQHGALPQLLSEWNVESAIPVLVESEIPEAAGRFGELATP